MRVVARFDQDIYRPIDLDLVPYLNKLNTFVISSLAT